MNREWKNLNELRQTDRDYSGLMYSYNYAKKNKNMKASCGVCCDSEGRWTKLEIDEPIEIKEDKSGNILYRTAEKVSEKMYQEFHTQFGTYVSDDQGEFGGTLVTPGGKTMSGNFRYIFDLKDKVYAVNTMAHMASAHFEIYQFTDADDCTCLYSVGGIADYILKKDIMEDLVCDAFDVKKDKAFFLLSGDITKIGETRQWWGEIRLLKLEDNKVEEIVRLAGYNPSRIQNVIVQDYILFISCDKMVIRYDLQAKSFTYYTCLTEEDEKNLRETEKKDE